MGTYRIYLKFHPILNFMHVFVVFGFY